MCRLAGWRGVLVIVSWCIWGKTGGLGIVWGLFLELVFDGVLWWCFDGGCSCFWLKKWVKEMMSCWLERAASSSNE